MDCILTKKKKKSAGFLPGLTQTVLYSEKESLFLKFEIYEEAGLRYVCSKSHIGHRPIALPVSSGSTVEQSSPVQQVCEPHEGRVVTH